MDQGNLDDAAYRQAIGLNPAYAEAHCNLGNALKELGNLEGAVAAHRQAISIRPDYAEAYDLLANELRDQGNLDEAVAAYRQAIGLKPELAAAHSNLGSRTRASSRRRRCCDCGGRNVAKLNLKTSPATSSSSWGWRRRS